MASLLEAIAEGKADDNGDGTVHFEELNRYVAKRDSELTKVQERINVRVRGSIEGWVVSTMAGADSSLVDDQKNRLKQLHMDNRLSLEAYAPAAGLLEKSRRGGLTAEERQDLAALQAVLAAGGNADEIVAREVERLFGPVRAAATAKP